MEPQRAVLCNSFAHTALVRNKQNHCQQQQRQYECPLPVFCEAVYEALYILPSPTPYKVGTLIAFLPSYR